MSGKADCWAYGPMGRQASGQGIQKYENKTIGMRL